MKLRVYQAIVASFTHQGIQPTLISMEIWMRLLQINLWMILSLE